MKGSNGGGRRRKERGRKRMGGRVCAVVKNP